MFVTLLFFLHCLPNGSQGDKYNSTRYAGAGGYVGAEQMGRGTPAWPVTPAKRE